jgi:2-hydroxychromene-2-carboxylate isomerase
MPSDEIMAAIGTPLVKQRVIENTEHSVARGTFGSPTLFVGDEIYFVKLI